QVGAHGSILADGPRHTSYWTPPDAADPRTDGAGVRMLRSTPQALGRLPWSAPCLRRARRLRPVLPMVPPRRLMLDRGPGAPSRRTSSQVARGAPNPGRVSVLDLDADLDLPDAHQHPLAQRFGGPLGARARD